MKRILVVDDERCGRLLNAILKTTEGEGESGEGGEGEGAGGGEGGEGGEGGGESHWLDSLTDDNRASVSSLTAEDALARLTYQAPDAYEVPEGLSIDETSFGEFSEIFKKHGISQDAVSDLLAADGKRAEGFSDAVNDAVKSQFKEGLTEMESTMGSEKFKDLVAEAHATMEVFATEKVTEFLEKTGLGDSPIMLEWFANIGKRIQEGGGPGGGGPPSGSDNSDTARLNRRYGHPSSQKNLKY